MLEDIRLTPMDFDTLNETLEEPEGIRFKDAEAIANTATDKAINKTIEFLIPKDYYPTHLLAWSNQLEGEQHYKSTLTRFLRELAENWQALKKIVEED